MRLMRIHHIPRSEKTTSRALGLLQEAGGDQGLPRHRPEVLQSQVLHNGRRSSWRPSSSKFGIAWDNEHGDLGFDLGDLDADLDELDLYSTVSSSSDDLGKAWNSVGLLRPPAQTGSREKNSQASTH